MKGKGKSELIFAIALTVLFVICLIVAAGYDEKARFVPLVVLIAAVAIAFIELISVILIRFHGKEDKGHQTEENVPVEVLSKEIHMQGWIIALLAMVLVFGLSIGTFVFTFFFLRFHYKEGWIFTTLISLLCFSIPYGIFIRVMDISLYGGLLAPLLK